ncbi:MAG: hypothetical protein IIA23_00340 [Chloroflexi bacterium]|nr:hypothetical protein [Chloroflexota bacterium]
MSLLKNPKMLGWIESIGALFGLYGLGWLLAGFWVQGVLRMIAGWILFFAMALALLGLWALFSFLPYPYSMMPAFPAALVWPAAAVWSGIHLQKRLEQTHRTQTA